MRPRTICLAAFLDKAAHSRQLTRGNAGRRFQAGARNELQFGIETNQIRQGRAAARIDHRGNDALLRHRDT